jgi:hypothetical protein
VGINWKAHERLHESTADRLREYYLLPGHLIKWYSMYGKVPRADSWVWKWFPDGDLWWRAVEQYGAGAVEHVTAQFALEHQAASMGYNNSSIAATSGATLRTAIAPDHAKHAVAIDWFLPPPTGFVIFYHIVLPENDREEDALRLVFEQLKVVAQSHAAAYDSGPATVFFNVVGGPDSVNNVLDLCAAMKDIQCRPMLQLDDDYQGETLQQLFQFCAAHQESENSSYRVAYINNQGPTQLRHEDGLEKLIRHLTLAVTSKMCVAPPIGSCNICGLVFYTMWTLFFPGNMFTATCSYVNKLLPPVDFERRMKEAIAQVLLAKLRLQVTTGIFSDRVDYLGLERYAMDHWIGSHPTVQPCDLSRRGFDYWRNQDRNATDFDWSMAPRHGNIAFGDFNSTQKKRVLASTSLRRREHQFLSGHLLKWYALYEQAPPPDSWVWSWFPDGRLWQEGVTVHGARVVEALTAEFSNDGM